MVRTDEDLVRWARETADWLGGIRAVYLVDVARRLRFLAYRLEELIADRKQEAGPIG